MTLCLYLFYGTNLNLIMKTIYLVLELFFFLTYLLLEALFHRSILHLSSLTPSITMSVPMQCLINVYQ